MEFVLGYVIIAIVLICMGFSIAQIGILTLMLMGVVVILIGAFFVVSLVMLAMSRRRSAVFSHIDEEQRFPVAVYTIDGEEVRNLFPCEMIMRGKLYVPDKQINLLYCKPRKATIDKNALVTIIAGSAVFIPSAVFVGIMLVKAIGMLFGA